MGGAQSSEHSSHFRRPDAQAQTPPPPQRKEPHEPEPVQLINISNKIVERLIDERKTYEERYKHRSERVYHDKVFIEKLRCMDESHSEQAGMLPEDLQAMVGRIQARASKIARIQPICVECEKEVYFAPNQNKMSYVVVTTAYKFLSCYSNNDNKINCSSELEMFQKCVSEQTMLKIQDRISDMENEELRKTRDLEKARKHNFWGTLDPQNVTN